ncbi:MAG: hypothetical protein QM802_07205 [Agriterribacter sp.]
MKINIPKLISNYFFVWVFIIFLIIKGALEIYPLPQNVLVYQAPVLNILRITFYIVAVHMGAVVLIGFLIYLTKNTDFQKRIRKSKLLVAIIKGFTDLGVISFAMLYSIIIGYIVFRNPWLVLFLLIAFIAIREAVRKFEKSKPQSNGV